VIGTVAAVEEQGPGAVAELAAEALRAVNHLTLVPPSPATPGWEDIGDIYRVLGEVRVLVDRLPQALGQLADHLTSSADAYETDAATNATPAAVVAAAVAGLRSAQECFYLAGFDLGAAQSEVSHLYAPSASERG
jgi:hypothetical protein